jgi:hypothetical protein
MQNFHRHAASALFVTAVTMCCGCETEEAQKEKNIERVQAKFKRGQEEAAKVIANAKSLPGESNAAAKKFRRP